MEGNADVALMLLKAGAVTDKLDGEGKLAIQLAPDKKVCDFCSSLKLYILLMFLSADFF